MTRTAHDWRDIELETGEAFDPVTVEERGTMLSIGRDREDWGSALTLWSREEVDALIATLQALAPRILTREQVSQRYAIHRCGVCPPGPPREPEPEPTCRVWDKQTKDWVTKTVAEVWGAGSPVHVEAKRMQEHQVAVKRYHFAQSPCSDPSLSEPFNLQPYGPHDTRSAEEKLGPLVAPLVTKPIVLCDELDAWPTDAPRESPIDAARKLITVSTDPETPGRWTATMRLRPIGCRVTEEPTIAEKLERVEEDNAANERARKGNEDD